MSIGVLIEQATTAQVVCVEQTKPMESRAIQNPPPATIATGMKVPIGTTAAKPVATPSFAQRTSGRFAMGFMAISVAAGAGWWGGSQVAGMVSVLAVLGSLFSGSSWLQREMKSRADAPAWMRALESVRQSLANEP